MRPVIGQIAVRAVRESAKVKVLADAGIFLVDGRVDIAFSRSLVARVSVGTGQTPLAIKRLLERKLERVISPCVQCQTRGRRRNGDRYQNAVVLRIHHQSDIAPGIDQLATGHGGGVKAGITIGFHPDANGCWITPVIHTVVDLAVGVLHAGRPALGHSLLETEDVLVLRHRAQVDIGNGCRQGQTAIADDAGLADLYQIERLLGHRVTPAVGVVGLGVGFAAGRADVGVGCDRDEVATGIAVHLER